MLTSPALDPELPAIELQAAHSGAGKGRRFPLPQDKGGPGKQPGAPDIGFRVFCKVERRGGGWEGLGWAFRRTAATCSQRETAGDRPIYLVLATMVMLTLVDADPLLTKSQSCYSAVRVSSQHQCDKEQ